MRHRFLCVLGVALAALACLALWPTEQGAAAGLAGPGQEEIAPTPGVVTAPDRVAVRSEPPVVGDDEADDEAAETAEATETIAITLRVVAAGAPVEGATVDTLGESLLTGADGRARFELERRDVSADWSKLYVSVETGRPGFADLSGWISVDRDEDQEIVLTLRHTETSFWARLVSAGTGRPLVGARLSVLQRGEVSGQVSTDASGLVTVTADPRTTGLRIDDPGLAPLVVAVMTGHASAAEALEVEVDAAARLHVQLVDGRGRLLPGAEARVWWFPSDAGRPLGESRGPWDRWRQAEAGPDGRLQLDRLPPRVPLMLEAKLRSQPLAAIEHRLQLEPGDNEFEVVVGGSGMIEGRVVDEAGAPVAGVAVTATRWLEGDPVFTVFPEFRVSEDGPRCVSLEDGRFQLGDLPAGRWWVGTELGSAERLPACALATVSESVAAKVELISATPRAIEGRVVGPDGAPVAAQVFAYREDPSTGQQCDYLYRSSDEGGSFDLYPLADGEWFVGVEEVGTLGLMAPVRLAAGMEDVELRLLPVTGVVRGRVTSADGYGVRAWVNLRYRSDPEREFGNRSDLDGAFVWDGLKQGVWDLMVGDGAGSVALGTASVVAGSVVDLGDVALRPAAAVLLRNGHDGATPIDALTFRGPAGFWQTSDLSSGATRWSLPPGTWTLQALRDGREVERVQLTLAASEERLVEFTR